MKSHYEKLVKKTNKKAALFKNKINRPALTKPRSKLRNKNRRVFFFKKINKPLSKKKRTFTKNYRDNKMHAASKRTFRKRIKRKFMKKPISRARPDTNIPLNKKFYKKIDALSRSYWIGRFINMLQQNGQKTYSRKEVYYGLLLFKYSSNANPILFFFELLDRIKPVFKLRNYIARRNKIKQVPVPVLPNVKMLIAVRWFKDVLKNAKVSSKNARISYCINTLLADFKKDRAKTLLEDKKKQYMKESIAAQFNARFAYRKKL